MNQNTPQNTTTELKYVIGLIGVLALLWSVTLSWFYFQLEMVFDYRVVAIWLGLLFTTLLFLSFAKKCRRLNLIKPNEPGTRWFLLLCWILIINTGLLYETGGTINPLTHFLLLPLALGMLILTTQGFIAIAIIAGALYTFISHYYVPLLSLKVASLEAFFAWYLQGSMLVFLGLVLLLAILIFPLKRRLESQTATLNRQKQLALQNETLLSVGSLASASVHQLSTPLNTLYLLKDLLKNEVNTPTGKAQLQTLAEQIDVCRQALNTLRERADEAHQHPNQKIATSKLLHSLKQEFALLHPKSQLTVIPLIQSDPLLKIDASFKLALMNLLDNAARYSPDAIRIQVTQTDAEILFRICDQGGGVSEETLATLGQQPQSDYHGMGMGVLLSRMIIERFGGRIHFENDNSDTITGLIATVSLPLTTNHEEITRL